ncbi:MAG TPA: F0F1 ATP synthase subunit C, partial [Erysipelotrichaceae bacterium]|nr:F0F1 ATP synthase subunit C [Erysipelotrichaceae bacterium]
MDINKGLIAIGAGLAVMTGMMTGRGEGEVAA